MYGGLPKWEILAKVQRPDWEEMDFHMILGDAKRHWGWQQKDVISILGFRAARPCSQLDFKMLPPRAPR